MDVRLFLVEDLWSMRTLIEDACTAIGDLRIVANEGTEAEARLWLRSNVGGWEIAVIDLVLEQGSGLGVVSECVLCPGRGRIAVFSSYASPGIKTHCLGLGADAVFDKSDTEAFLQWLDEHRRRAQAGA
ncbi:response regulator [Ramlibacter sp. G-1-2-2]|uniref:Response regulator n=1 Tax=Ramlibacter agri TaxID=2728837 RepID=A0A848H069_9BURK|nr:response regulator [Ramlibacter agri]NML42939.1 response regulator [Ramlibacter agri]